MAASSSDYFTKVSQPGGATSLAAPGHTAAGTSISVDSTSLWPTDTGVIFAIDTVTIGAGGAEVRDTGSYTVWEGVVSSATTITSMVLKYGTDQNYPAGSTTRVYILPTASRENRTVDGLLVTHNNDGTMITSLPLTTPKITTSINDSGGNEVIKTPATASAVNEVTIRNAATGNAPRIEASGGDSAVNLNLRGLGLAKTVTIGAGATPIFPYDYVVSGCVWTADNVGVNLNASMTAGVVVINGNPVTVALVTARAFTTNVDTYIDVLDNGDGTGLLVYTTAATNAASAALAANSIRIGIIQAAATITATTKVNQGQEDKVFPIASSIPYAVTDSLGNLICPRDPNRKTLGMRQIITNFATASTTVVQVTGLTCPVIIPTGRKISIKFFVGQASNSSAGFSTVGELWDGTVGSGTRLQISQAASSLANNPEGLAPEVTYTPTSTTKTYNAGLYTNGGGTSTVTSAGSGQPIFIKVELV